MSENSTSGFFEIEAALLNGSYQYGSVIGDSKKLVCAIRSILNEYSPWSPKCPTIRQVYYLLRARHTLELDPEEGVNNENLYQSFDKLLTKARENGDIDERRLSDSSRTGREDPREAFAETSPYDFVDYQLNFEFADYEESYWEDQTVYIEVWYEKDALSKQFQSACYPHRVPFILPCRGNQAGQQITEAVRRFSKYPGKEYVILYFGDLDPSGWNMSKNLQTRFDDACNRLSKDFGEIHVTVKRIGLNPDQVTDKPFEIYKRKKGATKDDSNLPRYKSEVDKFGKIWEFEVLSPGELDKMVRDAIIWETDLRIWQDTDARVKARKKAVKKAFSKAKIQLDEISRSVKESIRKSLEDSEDVLL